MKRQGTPKTLKEACKRGPEHVTNFLAQRFGAAIIHAEMTDKHDAKDALWSLWKQLAHETKGKRAA